MPSSEDKTVGWISRCMCMIREQRHMEGVARMGPVSPPPVVWLPCGCCGCVDGVDWSPASNISATHCIFLQDPPPSNKHARTHSVITSRVHKRILYLAAARPLFLLHAAPATSEQTHLAISTVLGTCVQSALSQLRFIIITWRTNRERRKQKSATSWDVTWCSLVLILQRIYCIHLEGQRVSQAYSKQLAWITP